MERLRLEPTRSGLKIYVFDPDLKKEMHLKTVKCKYEPVINNLDWVLDYNRILPTKEERIKLEMKYQLSVINWPNFSTKELINSMEPINIKKVELRSGDGYYVIVMRKENKEMEVVVSKSVATLSRSVGLPFEIIKRNY